MTFDTEDDSKGRVLLLNFYDGKEHFTFYDTEHARRWLLKLKKKYLIWAVNLEYDMMNLFKDDFDTFPKRIWFGKSRLICFMFGNQLFYDTLNHWKISVAQMAKVVGGVKEELGDAEQLEKRCKSDCEITFRYVKEMLARYDALGARARSTLPSSSLDLFVGRYNRMNHRPIETRDSDFLKNAYAGGRTECFYLGKLDCHRDKRKIYYVDINSMYPSVMLYDYAYPYTFRREPRLSEIGVTEATMEVNQEVPVLPLRHGGKLVFPNGVFRGTWTNAEINYAVELGAEVKEIHKGFHYPVKIRPFELFVEDLYNRRKEEKDPFMRDTYKLFMNSLYGKFGQGRIRKKIIPLSRYLENPLKYKSIGDPFIFDNRLVILNEESEEYPKNTILIWAAYVTAYARLKLHRLILDVKARGGVPLYCDTDSIMYYGDRDMVKHSLELGEFKIEHALDGVDIKLPKFYRAYKDHTIVIERVKGVPRKIASEFFEKNEATFQKPNKFFESMRRGLSMNKWQPITKHLRGVYDKGIVGKDGFVKPLLIKPGLI